MRFGNWLTADQGRSLLLKSQGDVLESKRNHAILALLIGCGLRRGELLRPLGRVHPAAGGALGHCRPSGKAGHIRTVPIPLWVKEAVDRLDPSRGTQRRLCLSRDQQSRDGLGRGDDAEVLWEVVQRAAAAAGIEKLAPHDLRRTCARLCHLAGGELDQIQFLLGHVSIQTTERYLGCKQKLRRRGERHDRHRTLMARDDYPSLRDYPGQVVVNILLRSTIVTIHDMPSVSKMINRHKVAPSSLITTTRLCLMFLSLDLAPWPHHRPLTPSFPYACDIARR